jgi:hypothetical protein
MHSKSCTPWLAAAMLAVVASGAQDGALNEKEKRLLDLERLAKEDVKMAVRTDKKQHPAPEAPPGKAVIYFVRTQWFAQKIQSKVAIDGQWIGANRAHNYFFHVVDPGNHFIVSRADNTETLELDCRAGATYFVEQRVEWGHKKARNRIGILGEEDGRRAVQKCHLSVSTPKKEKP